MFNNKEIFVILVSVIFFVLTLNGREKFTISIMIFFLSFGVVFQSKLIPLGLNGMLIWSIWFAIRLKGFIQSEAIKDWRRISNKIYLFYYFLVTGIVLALLQTKKLDTFTQIPESNQILNFSLYILTIVYFIKILVNFQTDYVFQRKMQLYFSCSIFLQLIIYILPLFGFSSFTESIQQRSIQEFNDSLIDQDVKRFTGVLGDYELIVDYVMVIIAISFINILNNFKKIAYFVILLTAIGIGLASGTRSFIVVIVAFFGIYFILSFFYMRGNVSILKLLFTVLFTLVISLFVLKNYGDLPIFERFETAIDIFNASGDLNEATNRHLSVALPIFLKNTSVLGNGSLYFNQLAGNEMVSHNLLMATYAKFGIVGLGTVIFLFSKSAYLLFSKLKKSDSFLLKKESLIYFSLIVSLFFQQMKISALRYQNTMLIYAFIFMLIYFNLNKKELYKIN